MKKLINFSSLIILLAIVLATPFVVSAVAPEASGKGDLNGDQTIFEDTFTLTKGQSLNGNLTVINGTTVLEKGSIVNGNVSIVGGDLTLSGLINGDLVCTSCSGIVTGNAEIRGSLVVASDRLEIAPEAVIGSHSSITLPFNLKFGDLDIDNWIRRMEVAKPQSSLAQKVLWDVFMVFAISSLSVLIALLFPKATGRVAEAVANQPAPSWGVGILTLVAFPIIMLIMTITLILIPLVVILGLAFVAAMIFGWVALSYEVGRRISSTSSQKWAEPIAAGVGSLLLGFILALVGWIPFLGVIVTFLVALFGLGAVTLSVFSGLNSSKRPPLQPTPPVLPVMPVMPISSTFPMEKEKPTAPQKVVAKPIKTTKTTKK